MKTLIFPKIWPTKRGRVCKTPHAVILCRFAPPPPWRKLRSTWLAGSKTDTVHNQRLVLWEYCSFPISEQLGCDVSLTHTRTHLGKCNHKAAHTNAYPVSNQFWAHGALTYSALASAVSVRGGRAPLIGGLSTSIPQPRCSVHPSARGLCRIREVELTSWTGFAAQPMCSRGQCSRSVRDTRC